MIRNYMILACFSSLLLGCGFNDTSLCLAPSNCERQEDTISPLAKFSPPGEAFVEQHATQAGSKIGPGKLSVLVTVTQPQKEGQDEEGRIYIVNTLTSEVWPIQYNGQTLRFARETYGGKPYIAVFVTHLSDDRVVFIVREGYKENLRKIVCYEYKAALDNEKWFTNITDKILDCNIHDIFPI